MSLQKSNLYGVVKHFKLFMVLLVSLWMLYSSMMKLVDYPGMEESFMLWGYGKAFMYFIGGIELLLAIALFVPQSRVYAAISIMVLMIAAFYTHIINYEYDQIYSAIFIFSCCIVVLFLGWLQKRSI
jgi:uncharacterized membrane protein YphA (DoxX/SURF4 family)